MAGIGFELKKLYKDGGILNSLRALIYTSAVTIGPQFLCITMIVVLQLIITALNISFTEKEIFLASVLYSFIFSQIVTSFFSMIVTRYVADKLYSKEYNKILPSLYGVMSICMVIGGTIGIVFFAGSKIHFLTKVTTYVLFMELILMWLETVYLSALKDYSKITRNFGAGVIVTIVISFLLLKYSTLTPSIAILASMDLGIFIIITLLMFNIQSFFKESDNKYFEFISYFDKYYSLGLIYLFYILSTYIHNFIYWTTSIGRTVADTYVFAPLYDVPTFYGFLTILPASVMFVISVETSFYERYREYYSQITLGGNLKDIIKAKKSMVTILWQEIFHLMEVQLFFTVVFVILGYCFLPFIGLNEGSVDIFVIVALGAYCTISMLVIILIDLYFENKKGAVKVSFIFLVLNIIFTLGTLVLGQNYFGVGFFLAALISLLISLFNLHGFISDIDYITFCSQPIINKEEKGFFSNLVYKTYMNKGA